VFIYIYCYHFCIKTVAIFSATYTLQQLNRSLRNKQKNKQKNEQTGYSIRLVTSVGLLPTLPNFVPIPALQQYSGAWGTSFVPAALTTRHILAPPSFEILGHTRLHISNNPFPCQSQVFLQLCQTSRTNSFPILKRVI
jgi:hypothetical protein